MMVAKTALMIFVLLIASGAEWVRPESRNPSCEHQFVQGVISGLGGETAIVESIEYLKTDLHCLSEAVINHSLFIDALKDIKSFRIKKII